MRPAVPAPIVAADERSLTPLLADAARAPRVALDVEASGMFAYHARPCTVQLAWGEPRRIVVVDALATPIAPLAGLLGPGGPVKIVHDVGFDARLLGEHGIDLGNVHDTAIAARMLGRAATGLAALLEADLGVRISKAMQHHDWRARPLDAAMLSYLATDVLHLEDLERALWARVAGLAIEDAVLEETRHRIATAIAAARAPSPPPYARVKGALHLAPRELAALRVVAELREREAQRRDVPVHDVASADALIAIARARPEDEGAVARVRGFAGSTPAGRAFARAVAGALRAAADDIPEDERTYFEPERPPPGAAKLRREREARLIAWRRGAARQRGVDEQVVLPGHCLKDAAEAAIASAGELALVPGIGAFRVERDGEAIVAALREQGPP